MQKQHREALMNTLHRSVNELFEIRNQFSPAFASKKKLLLETINAPQVKSYINGLISFLIKKLLI